MFELFKKHKWRFYWAMFGLMVGCLILLAISFEDRPWLGNALQTIGTVAGLYATLLLYLQTKEENDKQFREHLNHLQELTTKEIEAVKVGTDKQIEALKELTDLQIRSFQELTENQISAIQQATEKQIDALQKSTFDQINSFEKQTTEIATKLSDNSILLAEILGRELEKAIDLYSHAINQEQAKYNDLSGFKLLRTDAEKKHQLTIQGQRIEAIRRGYEYLLDKYNKLKSFFGLGTKSING